MIQSSRTRPLRFSIIATFLVGVVVALQTDNACFSWFGTPECSQHRLQCDRGTVFLTQASRGFKLENHPCVVGVADCENKTTCCSAYAGHDCLETYAQAEFSDLAMACWNRNSCNHRVQRAQRTNCSWPYTQVSGYSEVQYVCIDDSAIHDFSDSSAMTASSLALRYLSSHGSGYYVCRVTAEDCTSRTASVLLTKWPNTNSSQYCSSLRVTGKTWLPCSTSVSYTAYKLTTPFDVELNVASDENITQAWAVINADDSRNLRVECKPWTNDVSFQNCIPPTTAPTSPPPLSPRTASTAFLSSHSTGTRGTTAAGVLSSTTPSLASSPGSDVTTGTKPQSAENTGNTAAVVGGVVGAVVVLLVVVLVVVVLCVRRRSKPAKNTAQQGEDNSAYSGLADMTRFQPRTQADYESLRHNPDVSRSPDTSQPGEDNSAYSQLSDLTREQPRSNDSYETLGQTGRAGQRNASAPGDQTYINVEK